MEALIIKEKKNVLLQTMNTATRYGLCLGFKIYVYLSATCRQFTIAFIHHLLFKSFKIVHRLAESTQNEE